MNAGFDIYIYIYILSARAMKMKISCKNSHGILQLNVQADLLLEGEHNITTCFGLHSFNILERVCF